MLRRAGDKGLSSRRAIAAAFLFALGALFALAPAPESQAAESRAAEVWTAPIEIRFGLVDLHTDNPEIRTAGRLEYRGGLSLSSPHRRFGGFSGLVVSADGARLTAISDKGAWLRARLVYDSRGWLAGITDGVLSELAGPRGRSLRRFERDAEALARLPNGDMMVAFERVHRIWRYVEGRRPAPSHPGDLRQPPGLAQAPKNGGIEALTRLADGRLFVLTERLRTESGAARGWISGDNGWRPLAYRLDDDYQPTGADTLPSGDVLVLERRFSPARGVAARIKIVARRDIAAGARLVGRTVALLAPPLIVDNFEGISTRRGAAGETLVYIVSDDNFNMLQRTLLLMFALKK